jgi:hypothetical protein
LPNVSFSVVISFGRRPLFLFGSKPCTCFVVGCLGKSFFLNATSFGNVGGTYVKDAITGGDLISSIYLDDLLPLFDLKEVVIKMDVETHEANVLKGAEQFFKSVQVHYFLLEFVSHKGKESDFLANNQCLLHFAYGQLLPKRKLQC